MIHALENDGMPRVYVLEAVVTLARVYENECGNACWGSLHIVLSDGNTELENLQWCKTYAENKNDHIGVALAACLLELSESERIDVYRELDVPMEDE